MLSKKMFKKFFMNDVDFATFYFGDKEECQFLNEPRMRNINFSESIKLNEDSISTGTTTTIFILVALLCFIVCFLFRLMRLKLFHEMPNIDRYFDAGRDVSGPLLSTHVTSQWIWTASILVSASKTALLGVSGAFWYAVGAGIQHLLFGIVALKMKSRAPGAKTCLQIINARFGRKCHLVIVTFSLLTNVIVLGMLLLGGAQALSNITTNIHIELLLIYLMSIVIIFTLIGGVGAVAFLSYFATGFVFVIIIIYYYTIFMQTHEANEDVYDPKNIHIEIGFGNVSYLYRLIRCLKSNLTIEGNEGDTYMTMISTGGFLFGLTNTIGNFGTVFVDQAYYEAASMAQPLNLVWGFLMSGIIWMTVPMVFGTTMGVGYLAISSRFGVQLTRNAITNGYVAPLVSKVSLDMNGNIMMIITIILVVITTASSEIVAVCSIWIYDIYQVHVKPFRHIQAFSHCLLCGRNKGRTSSKIDRCSCISMRDCETCIKDDIERKSNIRKGFDLKTFHCTMHGKYREYMDILLYQKDWCIVIIGFAIIPYILILYECNTNLSWLYDLMGILIGPSIIPIIMAIFWARLKPNALFFGTICGLIIGLSAWLITSLIKYQKQSTLSFYQITGTTEPMVIGNSFSILSSTIITLLSSLGSREKLTTDQINEQWEKCRDIDNPLTPWADSLNKSHRNKTNQIWKKIKLVCGIREESYVEQRSKSRVTTERPTIKEMEYEVRNTLQVGASVSAFFIVINLVILPILLTIKDIWDEQIFTHWIKFLGVWLLFSTIYVLIMPITFEAITFVKQFRKNSRISSTEIGYG
ncbi:hypothetical protein SNEBB_010150 [Seison nebaliae]|nr:hypothetical protein SNEBB_010150 [Seison nebaliae]